MGQLRHAFKEWAVICRALASGSQSLLLRKGGIAEEGDSFRVEHTRFWLYPTYVHQQRDGVTPEAAALLPEIEADRPPTGVVRISHFAEVRTVDYCRDLAAPLRLAGMHQWSEETMRSRFDYRTPGLFVLAVRVYRAAAPVDLVETPEFAGCKTWVDLGRDLSTAGAEPVLDDAQAEAVARRLEALLRPQRPA